jgi:predicted transcriptional regulator
MATVTRLVRERPRTFTSNEKFIDEIRALLWASGKTWTQLALETNISTATVRRLASGSTKWPRPHTLFSTLAALKKGIAIVDI